MNPNVNRKLQSPSAVLARGRQRTRRGLLCIALAATPLLATAQSGQLVFADGFDVCEPPFPNGSVSSWSSVFGLWPAYNTQRRLSVPFNGYLAFQFNAPANGFGTFITTSFPGGGDGSGLVSISRTPGCFNPAFLGPNCLSPLGPLPQVSWSLPPDDPSACVLTPGQSYYLNLTFGGPAQPGEPQCLSGAGGCAVDGGQVQQ